MRKLSNNLKGKENSNFFSARLKPRDLDERDLMIIRDIKIIQERLKHSRLLTNGKLIRLSDIK